MTSEASKLAKEILVDVESSASSYKQLKEENEKLKEQNKTLRVENDKLKNRKMYKNLREEIEKLKSEIEKLKSEVEELKKEDEDSCECMECKNEFITDEMLAIVYPINSDVMFAIVDPENEEQTKFMCEECMVNSDYQNSCTECGNNFHFENGVTKNDGESYFDYCIFCYNDDKEALDEKYGKEEEEE